MFSAKLALTAAGAIAAAAAAVAPVAASAATTSAAQPAAAPRGCTSPPFYETWGGHPIFVPKPGKPYRTSGSAGQTIGLSIGGGSQVTTTETITSGKNGGISLFGIALSADKDVSKAIQVTVSNSFTKSTSYKVKHFATLQYGAWGYTYHWERGYLSGTPTKCVIHITARGTARSPASNPGFDRTGS
jgi:hypothetical protein